MNSKDRINLLCDMVESFLYKDGSVFYAEKLAAEWHIDMAMVYKCVVMYREEKQRRNHSDNLFDYKTWTELAAMYNFRPIK